MLNRLTNEPLAPNEPSLSLRQIEVFHAVMNARSITAASKVLNVSQPSLSRTIKRMEDILEISLFSREKNGLLPTKEAQAIFSEVDTIIRQLHGLGTQINRITSGEDVSFRLGSSSSVARALIPQALKALTAEMPRLEVLYDVLATDQLEDYLLSGNGECVITLTKPSHPLLNMEVLGTTKTVVAVHKDHPLALRPVITADDLNQVDFISYSPNSVYHQTIGDFLFTNKIDVTTRSVVRLADTAIALAGEGMGVALVDRITTAGPMSPNIIIKAIENAPEFDVFGIWNIKNSRSANVAKLIDILKTRITLFQDMPLQHEA